MIVGRRHIMKRWIIANHWRRIALSFMRAPDTVFHEHFEFFGDRYEEK